MAVRLQLLLGLDFEVRGGGQGIFAQRNIRMVLFQRDLKFPLLHLQHNLTNDWFVVFLCHIFCLIGGRVGQLLVALSVG